MAHVDDAPYVERTGLLDQLKSSISIAGDAESPRLVWVCPVCAGDAQEVVLEQGEIMGVLPVTAPSKKTVPLVCQCGHLHEQKAGCGYGALVGVPDSPGHKGPVEAIEVKPLTRGDRAWNTKAAELELSALSTMRSTAEKWAAALTSGLGVVGLAALLTGPGVFKHLTATSKDVAELAFFVAAVAALIAITLSTLAAQAARTKISSGSGPDFRAWAKYQIDKWHPYLSASRWLAAAAILFVLLSAGILWFGDTAEPGPTIIDAQGSALCPEASARPAATIKGAEYLLRCSK